MEMLLTVARRYWLDEASQAEIASEIGYSRPTVSRLLAEAKARGMVSISVTHPLEQALAAEQQLAKRFALTLAGVARRAKGQSAAQAVGRLAGSLLVGHGKANVVVALSNGRSVAAVVDAVPRQRWSTSSVTQMIGSLGRADDLLVDSPELCRRLAERLGGTYRPLPVPIVLATASVAESVRREEVVITTLELAARSDIALLGVGAVSLRGRSGGILEPYLTPQVQAEVRNARAVAHLSGHHFDARGRHVHTSLCERMICMPPERLADIALTIVVAWGQEKVPAIHAAMRTGLVNALVTDEETAALVLSYEP